MFILEDNLHCQFSALRFPFERVDGAVGGVPDNSTVSTSGRAEHGAVIAGPGAASLLSATNVAPAAFIFPVLMHLLMS
jgi:hypothetical protein